MDCKTRGAVRGAGDDGATKKRRGERYQVMWRVCVSFGRILGKNTKRKEREK